MSLRRITISLLLSVSQLATTGYLRAQQAASPTLTSPTPPAAPSQPGTAAQPGTAPQTGGAIHGSVKSGPIPLPGVSITATNTLTGNKYSTATDCPRQLQHDHPARMAATCCGPNSPPSPPLPKKRCSTRHRTTRRSTSPSPWPRARLRKNNSRPPPPQPASTPAGAPRASPSPTRLAALSRPRAAQPPRPQPSPLSPPTPMSPPNPSPSPARTVRLIPSPESTSAMGHRLLVKATQPWPATRGVLVALAVPAEVGPVDSARAEEASVEEAALGGVEAEEAAEAVSEDAATSATSIPTSPTAHSSGTAATPPSTP